MKAKQWEQLKNLTIDELKARRETLLRSIFEMKFQNKTAKIKNPLAIRNSRREVAKINTLIRMHQLKNSSVSANNKGKTS